MLSCIHLPPKPLYLRDAFRQQRGQRLGAEPTWKNSQEFLESEQMHIAFVPQAIETLCNELAGRSG